MLSPATPLTIAFVVAFVLLLLTTLTTPIIKSIPLGHHDDIDFGVLGWCYTNRTECSSPTVGYKLAKLWSGSSDDHIPGRSRTQLSFILVVHPIAAFLVFVCAVLAGTAHFSVAGHSPRYLLALLILTFPTLLVTLLAFLVDILLFVPPNMQWGGWIVLPAVLIITACSVVTCAMRRTLVSRMARKERIEKNEDMNGTAYFQMKAETQFNAPEPQYRAPDTTNYARAESPPPLDGPVDTTKTAGFSSYDRSTPDTQARSLPTPGSRSRQQGDYPGSPMISNPDQPQGPNGAIAYDDSGAPRRSSESRSRRPRGPMPPYGRGGTPPHGYGRGRGGYPPPRGGRGGYYPPRGGHGPGGPGGRGPPPGWNGYGRGGPAMGRGRGGPPPGYPNGYARGPAPPVMGPGGVVMYPTSRSRSNSRGVTSPDESNPWQGQNEVYQQQQDISDWQATGYEDLVQSYGGDYDNEYAEQDMHAGNSSPAYDNRPSTGGSITRDPSSFGFSGRQPSPARSHQSAPRSNSPPPPVPNLSREPFPAPPGQAVEMDDRTGSPAVTPTAQQPEWHGQSNEYADERSPPSRYATPAAIPLSSTSPQDNQPPQSTVSTQHKPRASSDHYYEDMDPRFSEDTERPPIGMATAISGPDSYHMIEHPPPADHSLPPTLIPGYTHDTDMDNSVTNQPQDPNTLHPVHPDSRDPSRSPAPSDEGSNFTSISQRGVNPQWQPGQGWGGSNVGSYGPPKWREQDQILTNNPDFMIPGVGPRARGGSASGNINMVNRGHARGISSGGSHRYPDPV